MAKNIRILFSCWIAILFIPHSSFAQEGFFGGIGWNTYFAKEQIINSDNSFQFTHSNASKQNGFLTQSLGNYGVGIQLGFRKDFNNQAEKNIVTLETQYCFNYQNIKLESIFPDFNIATKANFNHGFRLALGHRFNKIHPYIIVQGYFQTVTSDNSAFQTDGIIYDVADDGTILSDKLDDNGGSFSTEVFSFLGAFGIEYPIRDNLTLNIEYIPTKHVEYGIRDIADESNYFKNNLVVNQLQIGVRYYFANVFK